MIVSKKFVLEAHAAACINWKEKIEAEFPELFVKPLFMVGDWINVAGAAVYVTKIDDRGNICGPYFYNKNWRNDGTFSTSNFHSFTDQLLVKRLLTLEAGKRGYKKGNYNCLEMPKYTIKKDMEVIEVDPDFSVWLKQGELANCVFKDGVWAETFVTIEEAEALLGKKIKR